MCATDTQARVRIASRNGDQLIVHDGQDSPQVFPEVIWRIHAVQEPRGATAQWSCGPFTHVSEPAFQADCRLDIIIRQGPRRWMVVVPQDRTDVVAGDLDATVLAATQERNSPANVGLTVTFLNSQFDSLAEGDYVTTVVGTIAGN